MPECGQLVHAIVNHSSRPQVLHQGECHWRVEPRAIVVDLESLQERWDKIDQKLTLTGTKAVVWARADGPANEDILRGLCDVPVRDAAILVFWFLDKEDSLLLRKPAHQMLRALPDKIPAQVRKHNEIEVVSHGCPL